MGRDALRQWTKPDVALFKRRRWWIHNVNPPGPALVRITEDSRIRLTEDGQIRVTEGA